MPDSYQGFSLILQALESLHYGPAGQFQKDLLISRLYIHFHQWSKDCKLKVKNYIHAYKLKNIIPIMIQIINIYWTPAFAQLVKQPYRQYLFDFHILPVRVVGLKMICPRSQDIGTEMKDWFQSSHSQLCYFVF